MFGDAGVPTRDIALSGKNLLDTGFQKEEQRHDFLNRIDINSTKANCRFLSHTFLLWKSGIDGSIVGSQKVRDVTGPFKNLWRYSKAPDFSFLIGPLKLRG